MVDEAPDQELKEIKKRALRRLIIAIVLIAAAVAILTFLSRLQPGKTLTTSAPEPTRILPPEPQPIEQTPVVVEQAPQAEEMPASEPVPESPAPTEPPPPPKVINEAVQKPVPPTHKPEAKPSAPKPLVKSQPPQPPKEEMKPVAQPPQPPASKEEAKGYVVQLGVFSNPANAIQLQEKLKEHGIKSYTETKVHIGPFKDKVEAEAAVAKLKALGIGAVIVPQH